jgi:hypothetical protein
VTAQASPTATALWDLILLDAARPVRVPARRGARLRLAAELRARPAGTRLVVLDQGLLAGRRLADLARRAALDLELEYFAVPSLASPLFLVERSRVTQSYFARRLLTAPARLQRGWAASTLALRLLRRPALWDLVSAALCGRVPIWRRG